MQQSRKVENKRVVESNLEKSQQRVGLTPACRCIRPGLGGVHMEGAKVATSFWVAPPGPWLLCSSQILAFLSGPEGTWLEGDANNYKGCVFDHPIGHCLHHFPFSTTSLVESAALYPVTDTVHLSKKIHIYVNPHSSDPCFRVTCIWSFSRVFCIYRAYYTAFSVQE